VAARTEAMEVSFNKMFSVFHGNPPLKYDKWPETDQPTLLVIMDSGLILL